MKIFFAVFLVVHGLIHLIGTAKAFGVAHIPQLFDALISLVSSVTCDAQAALDDVRNWWAVSR